LAISIFLTSVLGTLFFWSFRLAFVFLGSSVLLLTNTINLKTLINYASLDVILFLMGMMIAVGLLKNAGLFAWIVGFILRIRNLTANKFLMVICFISALLSAVSSEVVSIIFVVAAILEICDYFEVDVSSDGGTSWANVLSWAEDHDAYGPGEAVSIDLTPFLSANVVVRFHYVAPGWDWWAEVDQVRVTGYTNIEVQMPVFWDLETDANGYYQVWMDEYYSPVTVTVTYPGHEDGLATNVVVSGQVTTTQDFDLRWLKPCVALRRQFPFWAVGAFAWALVRAAHHCNDTNTRKAPGWLNSQNLLKTREKHTRKTPNRAGQYTPHGAAHFQYGYRALKTSRSHGSQSRCRRSQHRNNEKASPKARTRNTKKTETLRSNR